MHRFFRFSFFDSADHWRGDFPAHVTDSIKAPAVPVFVSSLRDLTFFFQSIAYRPDPDWTFVGGLVPHM
jgi:hypothetical protein